MAFRQVFMKLYGVDALDSETIPYIVMVGDVGTGKSTIVEKVTFEQGRQSEGNVSATRISEPFWTYDGNMIISDTPGSNAMQDKLQHNIWIAGALNFMPVSRILIIVKAETRMDNVVDGIRKYAERLLELPMDVIGALVTHMDTVTWTPKDFMPFIEEELGLDCVVFTGTHTPKEALLDDLQKVCKRTFDLKVDHENFLKLFKINNNQMKILRDTNREVELFKGVKREFDKVRLDFSGKDLVDLLFEFQAWMGEQIIVSQKKVAKDNKFTFLGNGAANEAGHIANMTNQLRLVLYDVRVETAGFQSAHGVADAKRCPHCKQVWTKVEGCEGSTTCGNRPSTAIDVRDPSFGVLGTYTFKWLSGKLDITKSGEKTIKKQDYKNLKSFGCGKTINWKEMPKADLPDELREGKSVRMDEVPILSEAIPGASKWNKKVDGKLSDATDRMVLQERPGRS